MAADHTDDVVPDPAAPQPEGPEPGAAPVAEAVPAVAFADPELRACLLHPLRMLDVVLGERGRLAANLREGSQLRPLIAVLLTCSAAFAMPFALVDGPGRLLHVAMLFLGSVLLCYPSLQVFGSYLGLRLHPAQNLAIALVIPSAAALFTFGFAPIYWFLDATMPVDGDIGGPGTRVVLLVVSLLLALSHVNRCLFADASLQALRANLPLWIGWQLLVVFLTWRMANTLGLLT